MSTTRETLFRYENHCEEEFLEEMDESPPALKKPRTVILRKAGEVVTPIRSRPIATVKTENIPTVIPTARLTKTQPHNTKVRLNTSIQNRRIPEPEPEPEPIIEEEEDYLEEDLDDGETQITLENLNDKLVSLDSKLDQILAKLGQHDAAFKIVKYNIKDLRTQLQSSVQQTAAITSFMSDDMPEKKRIRKRLIIFPVADEDYLQRLEELATTDDNIRLELNELFLEAPNTSTYEFMRKNILALFENSAKYTWTGREGNNKDKAGCAGKLQVVDILINSACEKFPGSTRDDMERVCQRAMKNFNCTKYFKVPKRRMQRELAAQGRLNADDSFQSSEDALCT